MYNAFATADTEGSKGSTRLHMDMADAVNIMVYAEPCSDGAAGGARWDLFRAEDAPAIRKFLRDRFNLADGLDPIHSQQFYLDKQLRAELRAKTGIRSHRVIQRQGEAVFIPAGCAHQVCTVFSCRLKNTLLIMAFSDRYAICLTVSKWRRILSVRRISNDVHV
jgi:[histone H3]-dimethyl-L-lysine9 demethylase